MKLEVFRNKSIWVCPLSYVLSFYKLLLIRNYTFTFQTFDKVSFIQSLAINTILFNNYLRLV